MPNMRSIEIDFDVHQKIEIARRGFEESPNEVLRRLLGLTEILQNQALAARLSEGRDWSWKGTTLPHGTELQMEYNGKKYLGVIKDGSWIVAGNAANSPSEAAQLVAETKEGKKPSLNGWVYWQFKRPGERSWKPLQSLKKK